MCAEARTGLGEELDDLMVGRSCSVCFGLVLAFGVGYTHTHSFRAGASRNDAIVMSCLILLQ